MREDMHCQDKYRHIKILGEDILFFAYLFGFWFFKTGIICVTLAVLELRSTAPASRYS